jgi:hypothetical protein
MTATLRLAALALLLSACSQPAAPPKGSEAPSDPAAPSSPSPEAPAANGRLSQYTSLKACRVTESNPDEAGYSRSECPGVNGYGLVIVDADARQNLLIRAPGGGEPVSLRLPEQTGGGFSRLGDQAEWRGVSEGGQFRPDAVIVRYGVMENGDAAPETSYLLTVSLGQGGPCLAGKTPPGPDQNAAARAAADAPLRCLAR